MLNSVVRAQLLMQHCSERGCRLTHAVLNRHRHRRPPGALLCKLAKIRVGFDRDHARNLGWIFVCACCVRLRPLSWTAILRNFSTSSLLDDDLARHRNVDLAVVGVDPRPIECDAHRDSCARQRLVEDAVRLGGLALIDPRHAAILLLSAVTVWSTSSWLTQVTSVPAAT
jgi:hypothetical protein